MSDTNHQKTSGTVPTRYQDPLIAGLLAWLVPGLGHIYQHRYFKGLLIFVSVVPILLVGLWMGSYRTADAEGGSKLELARNVYFSWRTGDRRLYFVPQAMVGSVAIPAVIQARNVGRGGEGFFHNIFAPPRLPNENNSQPTSDEVIANLNSWYELSLLFTLVAGLMNVLAVLDALGGPCPPEPAQSADPDAHESDTGDDTTGPEA